MNIVIYPAIPSRKKLLEEVFRAVWYLSAGRDRISRIVILVAPDLGDIDIDAILSAAQDHLPDILDPLIVDLSRHWVGKVQLVTDQDALLDLPREQVFCVLHSVPAPELSQFPTQIARRYGGLVTEACREKRIAEAINYPWQVDYLLNQPEEVAARDRRNRKRFREFVDTLPDTHINICGTGPSLSEALASGYDFSTGINMVCNSAVTNAELLDRLSPRLLIAGDPVFHCGPTRYAAAFRRDLNARMHALDALLITQPSFVMPFQNALDESLHDRILGIPVDVMKAPNIDLFNEWQVNATENILTMYLLPAACSISNKINIFGCDGRSYQDNSYFWKHDPKFQYDELMQSTFDFHPAFFKRNFDDYLLNHCNTLERLLSAAENRHIRILNRSVSYLPPLAKRFCRSDA